MGFWQQVSGPFLRSRSSAGPSRGRLDAAEDLDQVRAGRVSQPVGDRRRVRRCGPRWAIPSKIRSIEIATFRTAVEIIGQDPEKWRPKTRETADHSLPYCTVVALVDGAVTAEQFADARLAMTPSLLDLVARGRPSIEDPVLTAGYPSGIPNRVTRSPSTTAAIVRREVAHPRRDTTRIRSATPTCGSEVRRPRRPGDRRGAGGEAVGLRVFRSWKRTCRRRRRSTSFRFSASTRSQAQRGNGLGAPTWN